MKERRLAPNLGRQRGGNGRRPVDNQQVAGAEKVRQISEATMLDSPRRAMGHQQAHIIPAPASLLRRSRGLQPGRQLEVQERGRYGSHDAAAGEWRSAARSRPLGRSDWISSKIAGTTESGSGRSEMSSPGKASWCI